MFHGLMDLPKMTADFVSKRKNKLNYKSLISLTGGRYQRI